MRLPTRELVTRACLVCRQQQLIIHTVHHYTSTLAMGGSGLGGARPL